MLMGRVGLRLRASLAGGGAAARDRGVAAHGRPLVRRHVRRHVPARRARAVGGRLLGVVRRC